MADDFEVDPAALRAAAARLDEHADRVGAIGETLAARTGPPVGRGGIGGEVEAAVRRLIELAARAVKRYYRDVGRALRRAADETERRDGEARDALDRLAPGRIEPVTGHAADLPADLNGWRPTQRTLDYLGYSREQMGWWREREALLGMTPAQYGEFRATMLEAFEREGVTAEAVDVRAHGSRARFYAGVHKTFEPDEELSRHPTAGQGLREWFGGDPRRPARHMVDSRYRLGLDEQRSDYDINLSSDAMVERAREQFDATAAAGEPYDEFWAVRRDGTPAHGFLSDALMRETFPHLREWADGWSRRLGARVSWAVFPSSGPTATTPSGSTVRFRATDWTL
jgi:uncharacterized protein YukE